MVHQTLENVLFSHLRSVKNRYYREFGQLEDWLYTYWRFGHARVLYKVLHKVKTDGEKGRWGFKQ